MTEFRKEKSMLAAYFIWILFGQFGFHRMYLGRVKTGGLMCGMIVTVLGIFLAIGLAEEAGTLNNIMLGILSVISITVLIIWCIWYLADAVLIAVMINKDRKENAKLSPDRMQSVFR